MEAIFDIIKEVVEEVYGISSYNIDGRSRNRDIVEGRRAYIFGCINTRINGQKLITGSGLSRQLCCVPEDIYYHLRKAGNLNKSQAYTFNFFILKLKERYKLCQGQDVFLLM